MEYYSCGSIDEYLKGKNFFTENDLRWIASCCLMAMSYLHSKGLIYEVN